MCNKNILAVSMVAALASAGPACAAGPTGVLVHSKFGGQIFGFDIDPKGTEGVLAEAQTLGGGRVRAAVETFDQASGKIIAVVQKIVSKDDFLTLGVVGSGIGLVEREHVGRIFVVKRIYDEIAPLGANRITGTWTPPLKASDIIKDVSDAAGPGTTAFYGFHNRGGAQGFVLGSNVAANTFGPVVTLRNSVFSVCCGAQLGYDSATNQAVLAGATGAVGGPPPVIALVDLATGKTQEFTGLAGPPPFGQGFVNGLAVDSADGIAATTTELDFRMEFYDLKTRKAFAVVLPGANGQLQSGSDVAFDPVNRLFLVAQADSSTGQGSSLQVFDPKGNLVESLNGFSFSNVANVVFTDIALNPGTRTGYVDGPDAGVTELQQFTY